MPSFHKLRVKKIIRETEEAVSIQFEIPSDLQAIFAYQSGQYLTLKTEIKGEEVRRSYSISSSPGDENIQVTVKQVPFGLFSTFANQQLKKGDELDVMPPAGRFVCKTKPSGNTDHLVFFAAGSGITPVYSIIKDQLTSNPQAKITLFYGNKMVRTIIFKEEIEGLKNKEMERLSTYHILSKQPQESPLFTGRMNKEKIEKLLDFIPELPEVKGFYFCGPESMIFEGKEVLESKGINKDLIHFELFTTSAGNKKRKELSSTTNKKTGPTSDIELILDGKTYQFKLGQDDENILDAALLYGADLPYACKGGVCCTCRAKVTEGRVEMDVNYALEEDELKAGFVLSCQAHPRTDKVVINFDIK